MNPGSLLLVAALGMGLSIPAGIFVRRLWWPMLSSGLLATLLAAGGTLAGGADWTWAGGVAPGGEMLSVRLDGISAWFLVLVSVVGGAGTFYANGYWTDARHPRSARAGRGWWSLMILALVGVLLSANGLHFLIAWEVFTLSAYFLITLDRQRSGVRAAGWLYLGASHVATLCLFAFFALLAARTGGWALDPARFAASPRTELAPLFWLALAGFGLKAGLFPLHVWLPSAHANAPSHVSAILSGVTIKLGIYGLVRFGGWLPVPAPAGGIVALLGGASAVLGVAFALGQHDIKRLLAYHSVENIGIIVTGLGFALLAGAQDNAAWGALALAGALLHVWNHGLFKALLFLGAGAVVQATGTREMSRLGGLWRAMPWTAGLFGLGAAAISGLPPLNGFVSEWLVYLGLFDAALSRGAVAWVAIAAAVLLAMTGALALACFVKVCGVVFLGAPRSGEAAQAHECDVEMRGSMLALAIACVAIGLAPALLWPALVRAAGSWRPGWGGAAIPAPLVALGWAHVALAAIAMAAACWLGRRVARGGATRTVTWDCGYAAPTAAMQYTAGSFADTIAGWFAWILCPVRHEHRPETLFPGTASLIVHTPETVLERVVAPIARAVLRLSAAARRLQHGRVQAYVFYLLAGIGALAAWLLIGEGQ